MCSVIVVCRWRTLDRAMARNPHALVEDLDRGVGERASTVSRISRERHRVVMIVDLDVIVGRDTGSASIRHIDRARSAAP